MRKLITDCTPSSSNRKCIARNTQISASIGRSKFYLAMAVCMTMQIAAISAQSQAQEIVGDTFYSQDYSAAPVEHFPAAQTYASDSGASVIHTTSYRPTYTSSATSSATSSGNVQAGLAQQKAQQAAQSGIQGHVGGGLGGAKYEGVGWSNYSAQNAIHSCCYWGTRPTAQIGVSKGNDGFWYACVLYH